MAEHGLAALVEIDHGAARVLWDTGATRTALLENAREMEIDLSTIDAIAPSYAHSDHTGAVGWVLSFTTRVQPRRWSSDVTIKEIDRTVDAIQRVGAELVCPLHCSGFKAMSRFAAGMPAAYVRGLVGTRFLL